MMSIQDHTAGWSAGDSAQSLQDIGRLDNLPLQLTSFVGREAEIERLRQLLDENRLLTLTGAGGVGKTRLGLRLASDQLTGFRDGVWLVELGSLYEPQMVVHKLAATVGCGGDATRSRLETLVEYLQHREMLIVLDNCEHLVQTCAELVAGLLLVCPDLRVLATSREPLGVPGEIVHEVPPLSLPGQEQPAHPGSLGQYEAVQLFVDRARMLQPEFAIDETTAAPVARICTLLDGMPLAVELAAARVRVLSPQQIAERLSDDLQFLTSGDRTAVSRHQTIQASVDWSYAMLSAGEQLLFRRLAVFAGEFILEDAGAVCTGPTDLEAEGGTSLPAEMQTPSLDSESAEIIELLSNLIELLSNLVNKSLVLATPDRETVYRLLNPIQHYGWVRLGESSERRVLQDRHLDYYLELAEQFHPIRRCSDLPGCFRRLALEIDNFRAALDWALQSRAYESGLRMASLLGEYWWRHGYAPEGLEWIERFLSSYADADITRGNALLQAGRLSREGGDYESSSSILEQSLRIFQEHRCRAGIAQAICQLGVNAHYLGDQESGIGMLEQGLAIYRELGDDWNVASKLLYLGDAYRMRGDNQKSTTSYQEGLSLFEELKDAWGTGWALGGLGVLARLRGDYRAAVEFFSRSLQLHVELGDRWDFAFSMEAKAKTLAELGLYRQAAVLWGFTETLRRSIQSVIPPAYRADYSYFMDAVRAELGEAAFEEAWQEGRKLTFGQAVSLATQPLPDDLDLDAVPFSPHEPEARHTRTATRYGLTAREVEVLRLVSQGLTDAQVAEELVISPRTVSKHLQSIYGKLQANSRSAATRFALEHGIE